MFITKDGRELISVPMAQVTGVSNSFQTDPGSFGRKLALGIFASRKAEYLYLNTESPGLVEVLVFKTKKNMSPEMMAKIRHNMKPAAGARPRGGASPVTLPLLYLAGGVALAATGPGAYSLDALLGLSGLSNPRIEWIAIGIAYAIAALTLAAPRPAPLVPKTGS